MNPHCPTCNLKFERESGYFLGAMIVSYLLGLIVMAPIYIPMSMLKISYGWILIVCLTVLTFLSSLLFRYSRVIWLHFDFLLSPWGNEKI